MADRRILRANVEKSFWIKLLLVFKKVKKPFKIAPTIVGEETNDHKTNFPIPQRKYFTLTDNGAGKANCSRSAFQQKKYFSV